MNLSILFRWLILSIAVWVATELIPGIDYDSVGSLLIAALVLGVLNALVKPLLTFVSLPFIILTLGFFLLVINAAILKLTAWLVPGFTVTGFWPAVAGSVIVSLVSFILGRPEKPRIVVMKTDDPPDDEDDRRPPSGKGPIIDV